MSPIIADTVKNVDMSPADSHCNLSNYLGAIAGTSLEKHGGKITSLLMAVLKRQQHQKTTVVHCIEKYGLVT